MVSAPLDGSLGGGIKRGEALTEPTHLDLYDKIINVKLVRKDGTFFCIRSDYEVAVARDGTPYFIRCRQKPQIELTYKQAAGDTTIKTDLRITNLHIMNDSLGKSIFSNDGNPIVRAEVQMGYRGQFPNFTGQALSSDKDKEPNRLDMFYEMNAYTVRNSRQEMDTGLRLDITVLACWAETLPPDRVIRIQGVVGKLDYGIRLQTAEGGKVDLSEALENDELFPSPDDGSDALTSIEKLLYLFITQRFFRNGGFTYRIDKEDESDEDDPGELYVLDYDAKTHAFITDSKQFGKAFADRWSSPLDTVEGLLAPEDAVNLGVICNVSPGLKQLSNNNRLWQGDPFAGGVESFLERVPGIKMKKHLGAQIDEFVQAYPNIRWYQMNDGSFYFYDFREGAESVTEGYDKTRAGRERRPIILPAVYDITIGAMRTITCPFIGFISSLQLIGFRGKYNLGDRTGFFVPHAEDKWYRSLLIDIEFDTTGDKNRMAIQCVDADPPAQSSALANITPGAAQREQGKTGESKKKVFGWAKAVFGEKTELAGGGTVAASANWRDFVTRWVLHNEAARGAAEQEGEAYPDRDAGFVEGFKYLMSDADNESANSGLLDENGADESVAGLFEDKTQAPAVAPKGTAFNTPRGSMQAEGEAVNA